MNTEDKKKENPRIVDFKISGYLPLYSEDKTVERAMKYVRWIIMETQQDIFPHLFWGWGENDSLVNFYLYLVFPVEEEEKYLKNLTSSTK